MSIFSQRFHSGKYKKGFTLIELMVVMAIMVILTATLLLRQTKFDSSTLLRSLAYSVALSVRQAQVYGTSVFGTTTTSTYCGATNTYTNGACFAQGYGIHIDYPNGGPAPTSYILFADLNNDGTYTPGEDVKVFNLGKGYVISNICATTGGTQFCTANGLTSLSIVYKRPNPEACITASINTADCGTAGTRQFYTTSSIQIQATSDPSSTRRIYINSTGLISVGSSGT